MTRDESLPATLQGLLERAARNREAGIRLLDRRERETWLGWREISQRAELVAGGLAAGGIRPGDRVALVFPTCPGFFHAFFGVLLAGAVPVPLYPPVRLGRLEEYHLRTAGMVQASGARLILTDRRVRRILGRTVELARAELGCRLPEDLPTGAPPALGFDSESLALVQFSSGTTAEPKPVALSHRAILAQVRTLNGFWPDDELTRHTGASWLPLYHDMGLIGCVFPALERPSVLTLLPPEAFVAKPALWLRAISRYGATISPAPSFAYGLCADKIRDEELDGVDLSTWRVALNGAEPVAPDAMRRFVGRFSRWGLRPEALTPVYGLSEAALAVTFSRIERPFTTRRFSREALSAAGRAEIEPEGIELASVGRPLPGFEVEIRRPGTSPAAETLDAGRVGRIHVKGPSLMEGYLGLPGATAEVLSEGWLDTGDLGFLLDGELFLTGRAKDVLIVRGRNHAPDEIERPAGELADVRSGCVAAVAYLPVGRETEEILLFAERDRQSSMGGEALAELCRRRVLAHSGIAVRRVVVLEPGTLPRTSSGKIRRRETLRRYLADELVPPDPVNTLGMTLALGRSIRSFSRARKAERDGSG